MRDYELTIIVHPDLDETAVTGVVERVQNWITESGGSVEKVDNWGRRRLAYSINKQREGSYVLLFAKMPPASTAELERNLRFLEPVIRYMLISPESN